MALHSKEGEKRMCLSVAIVSSEHFFQTASISGLSPYERSPGSAACHDSNAIGLFRLRVSATCTAHSRSRWAADQTRTMMCMPLCHS